MPALRCMFHVCRRETGEAQEPLADELDQRGFEDLEREVPARNLMKVDKGLPTEIEPKLHSSEKPSACQANARWAYTMAARRAS